MLKSEVVKYEVRVEIYLYESRYPYRRKLALLFDTKEDAIYFRDHREQKPSGSIKIDRSSLKEQHVDLKNLDKKNNLFEEIFGAGFFVNIDPNIYKNMKTITNEMNGDHSQLIEVFSKSFLSE